MSSDGSTDGLLAALDKVNRRMYGTDIRADLERVTAERDRYRAALEQIAAWRPDGVPIPNVQARTAREALNPPPVVNPVTHVAPQPEFQARFDDEPDDPRIGDAEDARRDPEVQS